MEEKARPFARRFPLGQYTFSKAWVLGLQDQPEEVSFFMPVNANETA